MSAAPASEPLAQFVQRRQADWKELEAALARLERASRLEELERVDRLYRRLASDLSAVQARYAGTDVEVFLTGLASRAYATIYRRRPELGSDLRRFFSQTFPAEVRALKPELALSAAMLFGGMLLGILLVAWDDDVARTLLPQGMRDVVARRELWTDRALEQHAPSELATEIFLNNLSVCFRAAAGGLTFGLLTVVVLFSNGLSIGAVYAHCAAHGLLPGILDFTSAHGPVELSVIVLTGAAGLAIARALIDPGELPRVEALRGQARKAIVVVLGSAPLLVGIGVIEGFVSPGDLFPTPVKAALGVALGASLWTYLYRAGRTATR